jgi:putative phage-type endonuclease
MLISNPLLFERIHMNSRLNFPFAERTRPLGLGGTDIGAILGLSPYKTPLELWSELVSGEGAPNRDLIHLRFGQHAESFIASEYERATDHFTVKHAPTLFHKQHGFMFGHVDRFVVETPDTPAVVDGCITAGKLLECKTSSAFSKNDWGEPGTDQVPPLYLVQCAWYMAITECHSADLAVLIGNSDFRLYTIERDLELEGLILSHAQHFWSEHVLAQVPPAPMNVQDAAILFPKESSGLTIEANEALLESIRVYQDNYAKSQSLSTECDRLKLEILNYMGHAEKLTHAGKTLATWKCTKASNRIDAKALAQAHPDIAAAFTASVLGSRRFLLKGAS